MKRTSQAATAAVGLLAGLAPISASAKVIELGQTPTALVAPVCPPGVTAQNCTIVLTQVTALATIRDSVAYPTTATRAGYIVAFTVGLSRLSTNAATARADIHFLDSTYGGTTQVAITVLKPKGPKLQRGWVVTAESGPTVHVQPYLGEVVQFPLAKPLAVARGDVIALTVPTWAPVLSFGLPLNKFAYRQSRTGNCQHPASSEQAQLLLGAFAHYQCDYPGTRVEYSATEITAPVPPKNQIHAPDIAAGARVPGGATAHNSGGTGLQPKVLGRVGG